VAVTDESTDRMAVEIGPSQFRLPVGSICLLMTLPPRAGVIRPPLKEVVAEAFDGRPIGSREASTELVRGAAVEAPDDLPEALFRQ
jgi:hypothetical protein